MKKIFCLLLSLTLMAPAFVFAESAKTETDRIAELEERVERLEEMVEALTKGDALAAHEEAAPGEGEKEDTLPEAETLAVGDSFEVLDKVTLTVNDYELTPYFTYYSRQNSYNDFFGFSPFFGPSGSSYGQRTIRSGDDYIYLVLDILVENDSADDITVGEVMQSLADFGDDPVEPEQSFLYYSRNYDGFIAGDTTLQLGPRSKVDAKILFVMPREAENEENGLNVVFQAEDGQQYAYALRRAETGLLLDQFGESQSF